MKYHIKVKHEIQVIALLYNESSFYLDGVIPIAKDSDHPPKVITKVKVVETINETHNPLGF